MTLNQGLAQRLALIAKLQDLLGMDRFRAISNERASRIIDGLSDDISELAEDRERLLAIDGIGPKIADKIIEFCTTGKIEELDELSAQVPVGVLKMLEIPGLGPKTAALLWKQGKITDVEQLAKAIDDALSGKEGAVLLSLPRMGEKSIRKIKESMNIVREGSKRLPLGVATVVAQDFVEAMEKIQSVKKAIFAGSVRRGKETVGDIDILVCVDDLKHAPAVVKAFISNPRVVQVITGGQEGTEARHAPSGTRASVRAMLRLSNGRVSQGASGDPDVRSKGGSIEDLAGPSVQVDLRVLPIESFGAALMYFTGSKEHNIRMRERAQKRGYTLTDYGLFPEDHEPTPPHERGIKPVAGKTEEEIYKFLDLPFIPPEIREDRGELDLKSTPKLIEIDNIKAELHAHTTASDGDLSIEELAREAHRRGFHTIAVTDHSRSSAIAGGLSIEQLEEHIENVRKAQEKINEITILAGSEVDILADGSLDYPDKILKKLDIVVASPHSALSQEPALATKRLLAAIKHPLVHIIGHPTGRLINRRPGLSPDIHKLIAAAVEHHVALELNAHWMRLDLRDIHVKAAVDAKCLVAIDCDVHARSDFDNLRFGITTARRGWLTTDLCVNTWSRKNLSQWLQSKGRS